MFKSNKQALFLSALLTSFTLLFSTQVFAQETPTDETQTTDNTENTVPDIYRAFSEDIKLKRGLLKANEQEAIFLTEEGYCGEVKSWGWRDCSSVDAFVYYQVPNVNTTIVEVPTSDGYVKLDDWKAEDKSSQVANITSELRESTAAQSRESNQNIIFLGWVVEPTLIEDKKYMYYAYKLNWNGEDIINVKATIFDRRGYVVFRMVPESSEATPAEIETQIAAVLGQYEPRQAEAYAAFQDGDKVATYGAMGVLATLVGVKIAKSAGFLGIIFLFLKKAWFLLLIPFYFLRNLLSRKDQ